MYCNRCKTTKTFTREQTDENGDVVGVKMSTVGKGRMFVDRVFSENRNYEVVCLNCGTRRFVAKNTRFGQWLDNREEQFANAASRGR